MRNMRLVDACIAMHEISRTIEEEIGKGGLSEIVRECADKIHEYSLIDSRLGPITKDIIDKVKK